MAADNRGVVVDCRSCGQKNRLTYAGLAGPLRCARCKQAIDAVAEPVEVQQPSHFDQLIATAALPVIVDFWAPWWGPCRMVAPEIAKVAARNAGRFLVVKVNTDELGEVGQRLQIRSIPTLAVFTAGREAARMTGARPAADIEAFAGQAVQPGT